jgi:hypothetical protein
VPDRALLVFSTSTYDDRPESEAQVGHDGGSSSSVRASRSLRCSGQSETRLHESEMVQSLSMGDSSLLCNDTLVAGGSHMSESFSG